MLSMGIFDFWPILFWIWLLIAVKCFGNFSGSFWRLILASILDALLNVISLTARWAVFRSVWGKFVMSFPLVSLAYPVRGRHLFLTLVYFYLIGFAMAGGVMALIWLVHDTDWQASPLPYTSLWLGMALLLALAFSHWGCA